MISPKRREEIIDALRRGTVPQNGLGFFSVGLNHLEPALKEEIKKVSEGGAVFKCVQGEYGTGKTFFARWLQETAKSEGFATAEVQISETETPLHRLETVYRRLLERLSTSDAESGALRSVIDGWFYCLEEDIISEGQLDPENQSELLKATDKLMTQRLGEISKTNPSFAAVLRGYRKAISDNDPEIAEGLIAWLSGQPNISAGIKRKAGIKGDIDHFGALTCLQGLLTILRDSGKPGLILVLDEVETLQRVRGDVREKSLNALRQLIDEIDGGRFPGLYLLITGTPAFYEGTQGIQRLPPLAQRVHVDFTTEARFDNPRAIRIRLSPFTLEKLVTVGIKVRDLYSGKSEHSNRILSTVDDQYIEDLAKALMGNIGAKVGVAPRIFLKKLVEDILDRVDQFDDFNPREHYKLTISSSESEKLGTAQSVDDIELNIE